MVSDASCKYWLLISRLGLCGIAREQTRRTEISVTSERQRDSTGRHVWTCRKQYPNIHFNAQVCLFLHVTHTVRLRRLCTVCVHANVLYALRYCVWRKVFVLLNMTPFFSFPALSLNIHQFCTFTKVSLTLRNRNGLRVLHNKHVIKALMLYFKMHNAQNRSQLKEATRRLFM